MIPRLYVSNNSYGTSKTLLGNMDHTSKCVAKETLNGENQIELVTDINDFTNEYISVQKIIEVKPNPQQDPQLYIIDKVERKINGKINISANHISSLCNQYITNGIGSSSTDDYQRTLSDVTPKEAWDIIMSNYMPVTSTIPFNFTSDITTTSDFSLGLVNPETIGNILGGTEGSFLDTWGGYYEYDNFNINLLKSRGVKQNYKLMYGHNISDATQTEDTEALYSHILPYGEVQDVATDSTITLYGSLVSIENTESKYRKLFLYDCSSKSKNLKVYSTRTDEHDAGYGYDAAKEEMTKYAATYAKKNTLGNIHVNIKVTHRAELEEMSRFSIGDEVSVILDSFGTATTARITEVEYDVLNERWNTLNVGESAVTLASILLNHEKYLNGKF